MTACISSQTPAAPTKDDALIAALTFIDRNYKSPEDATRLIIYGPFTELRDGYITYCFFAVGENTWGPMGRR